MRPASVDPKPTLVNLKHTINMEATNVLATVAQVAATLIGFTGVIFAIGRFSEGGLDPTERNALIHLLMPAAMALFLALAPMVAASGVEPGVIFWRVFNAVLAAVHAPVVTDGARAALRGELPEPIRLQLSLVIFGYLTIAANVIVALGYADNFAVLAYLVVVSWFLVVSVVEFILLILAHTQRVSS
jgi:hypothetical protein